MKIPTVVHFLWLPPSQGLQLPDDVKSNVDSWRKLAPAPEIMIWSRSEVYDLVGCCKILRIEDIESCKFLAMQADLIRLFLVLHFGGLWSDLKNRLVRPVPASIFNLRGAVFTVHAPTTNRVHLSNSFFGAPPGHEVIETILRRAVSNVRARTGSSVFNATGPGLYESVLGELETDFGLGKFRILEMDFTWDQHGQTGGFLRRSSASYNGPKMEEHWSVKEKQLGIYK